MSLNLYSRQIEYLISLDVFHNEVSSLSLYWLKWCSSAFQTPQWHLVTLFLLETSTDNLFCNQPTKVRVSAWGWRLYCLCSSWLRSVLSSPLFSLMGSLRVFFFFFFFPSPIRPIQKMSTRQKNTNSIPTQGIISFLIKHRITTPKEKMFWDDINVSFDLGWYCGLLCERHESPSLPCTFLTFTKLLNWSETAGLKVKQKAWSIKEHYQPQIKIQPQWSSSL